MSDVDTDDGTELDSGDPATEEFMEFLAGEDLPGDDDDSDGGSDEGGEPADASDAASEESDGDAVRARGRERLAGKLSAKEQELRAANRRVRELEAKLKLAERTDGDSDLIEDRVAYVRGQIAKGLGLKADHARVAEELRELMNDLVLADVTPEMLADPKHEALRRQVEEQRARNQGRRDRIAVERRLAEVERREAEAAAAQTAARVKGQLDGWLRTTAEGLPYLSENPDGHPVELVYEALLLRQDEGHDLSTPEAMTAAVTDIVGRLESHYASVADRLAAVKAKRDAATGIDRGSAKRQAGAASGPKGRTGGRAGSVSSGAGTVTASKGNGGRGSAPSRTEDDEESFDEFLQRGLSEARAARRRR
jgi:anti-sigma28 factor (negative regulator of flagellin synthesis)